MMADEQTTDKVRRKMKLAVEAVKKAKFTKMQKRHKQESDENVCCNINFNSLQVSTLAFL